MDADELRGILSSSKVDVWTLIDSAVAVAAADYGEDLKDRRDGIVQKLYFPTSSGELCRSCRSPVEEKAPLLPQQQEQKNLVNEVAKSSFTPESNHQTDDDNEEEGGVDLFRELFDDEPDKIRDIREQLEDPHQDEESLVGLLQNLVDMDITFKALQETDIGRVVSGFRKQHPSNEVRKLAKLLIRNWKETVDEWVRLNPPEQASASLVGVGDSPQLNMPTKNHPNGHYQVSDSSYSPNPQNWGSGSEKNYVESAPKAKAAPRRDTPPTRPPQSAPAAKSCSAPPPNRQKESSIDIEKLNSARRRLQESYQEAQNAKRQRTIQVMDLHDLPKPKNTFFAKNKGGGRNHR